MSAFKLLLGAATASALIVAGAAQATVLVTDNFEGYSPTQHGSRFYDLNFTAFTSGLHAQDGTVDLIGSPNAWSLSGASNFVDLDGSTENGGTLRTSAFTFGAGDVVTLAFDLAGNQRGGTDQWDFGFQTAGGNISFLNIVRTGPATLGPGASAFGPAIGAGDSALPYTSLWNHYSMSFTAGNSGSFTAYVGTTSHDNIGPLVDNFVLTRDPGLVPEPATWLMMIMGFGGVGALLRRRGALVAFA